MNLMQSSFALKPCHRPVNGKGELVSCTIRFYAAPEPLNKHGLWDRKNTHLVQYTEPFYGYFVEKLVSLWLKQPQIVAPVKKKRFFFWEETVAPMRLKGGEAYPTPNLLILTGTTPANMRIRHALFLGQQDLLSAFAQRTGGLIDLTPAQESRVAVFQSEYPRPVSLPPLPRQALGAKRLEI